jgi:CubicO group peptidase (beta-lactamase class C family)
MAPSKDLKPERSARIAAGCGFTVPAALAWLGMLAACGGGGGGEPSTAAPAERYPLAAAQGVDAQALERACSALAANRDVRFLLVERNGVLVMEEYFNGADAGTAYDVRSVTKSLTSVLVGIALDVGLLRSLDQTIGEFLDPVVPCIPRDTARIPLRHLLTMTSGLPWRELNVSVGDFGAWVGSPDPLLWILERPLEHEPGTHWNYNTGASHILSAILTEATGLSAREFAQQRLFDPLGSASGSWLADPRGYNYGGHGVSLSGRTMIRLGRLFLDGGSYQGRQIVSLDWVRQSTSARYSTGDVLPWSQGYGYQWWVGRDDRTGLGFYFAMGYGGQFLVNVPARNATIAAATAWSGVADAGGNWTLVLRTIVETVLPGLR